MPGVSPIVLREYENGVLTLSMNRPKVNALNFEMIAELQDGFKQAERDKQTRCVILTGAGMAFSAGQDVNLLDQVEPISFRYHLQHTYNPLVLQIRRLEKPVIAAVNGVVSGAALGLALACDLRIAADQARFVVGFAGIGLAPDSAVSLLLPALVGLGRATEMAYSNAPVEAAQALEWGLVNRVVASADLPSQARIWAEQLASGALGALALAKRAFNKAVLRELEQVLDYEAHLQEIAGRSAEHKEGVRAFLEKRPPNFNG